jgi:hypothetical protein
MIIGISGYAGSGKSTAAAALVDIGWSRRKFAAPLKNMIRSLLIDQGASAAMCERMVEGDLKEVPSQMLGGQTPRHAMQALGTEWGRMRLSDSLWVDAALRTVSGPTVFDDVRFGNEANAIRALGGIIVRIDRPGVGPVNGHESERLPGGPVVMVWNTGDKADLAREMRSVAASLRSSLEYRVRTSA